MLCRLKPAVQFSAVQCHKVQFSALRYSSVQFSAIKCTAAVNYLFGRTMVWNVTVSSAVKVRALNCALPLLSIKHPFICDMMD